MPKNNLPADAGGDADQVRGAPEIDPKALDVKRQQEIEAAFSVERDADVVVELPPDGEGNDTANQTAATDNGESAGDQAKPAVPAAGTAANAGGDNRLRRLLHGYWVRKRWTLPLTALVLAGAVLAVPATRYPLLAAFMKKDVTIVVLDAETKRPVASALISLDGTRVMSDNQGKAMIKSRVGQRQLAASKRYYRESSSRLLVPVTELRRPVEITLQATGRQVPLAVVNKLTGRPVENALLKAAGTEVKTDKDGKATLVLPADKPEQAVEVSADTYNGLKSTLVVTESANPKNTFSITPTGKVYVLSKQSGKIDVIKTDLDGTNRQVVVAGTGREEERNTILLASRDWKYLALLSRRDSDKPKLYLLSTADDKLTVMDEGDADFQLVGWSDHHFVYRVTRNAVKEWQPKQVALKSYNAAAGKIGVLDENQAEGDELNYKYQNLSNFYLVGSRVVYTAEWSVRNFYYDPAAEAGKTDSIRSVSASGGDRKDLRVLASEKYFGYSARLYAPDEVYFSAYSSETNKPAFFEYESGAVKPAAIDPDDFFNKTYPTYLASPSNLKTFWSEQRDGKDTFFVGDKAGEQARQVAVLAEHQVYGWYSDDYLLVSKKGSELFVLPAGGDESAAAAGGTAGVRPGQAAPGSAVKVTKVTDYHRPEASFRGYGGGYGGL